MPVRARRPGNLSSIHFFAILTVLASLSACSLGRNGTYSVPADWVLHAVEGNFAAMDTYDASGELTVVKDRKAYDLSVRLRMVFPSTARLDMLYGGSMGVMGGKTMSLLLEDDRYIGYVPDENTYFRGEVGSSELEELALDAEVLLLLLMGRSISPVEGGISAVRRDDKYVLTSEADNGNSMVIEINADVFLPTRVDVFSPDGAPMTSAEAGGLRRRGAGWIATSFRLSKKPGDDRLTLRLEPKAFAGEIKPADLEIDIPEGAIEGELEL